MSIILDELVAWTYVLRLDAYWAFWPTSSTQVSLVSLSASKSLFIGFECNYIWPSKLYLILRNLSDDYCYVPCTLFFSYVRYFSVFTGTGLASIFSNCCTLYPPMNFFFYYVSISCSVFAAIPVRVELFFCYSYSAWAASLSAWVFILSTFKLLLKFVVDICYVLLSFMSARSWLCISWSGMRLLISNISSFISGIELLSMESRWFSFSKSCFDLLCFVIFIFVFC